MDNSWKSELTPDMLDDALHCAIAEEIGSDNLLCGYPFGSAMRKPLRLNDLPQL